MSKVFAAIGRLAVRFRWVTVAVWITGLAAALILLPSLPRVTQHGGAGFLPPGAPSQRAARLAEPLRQPGLTTIPVVAARPSGPLTRADRSALQRLSQELGRLPHVTGVRVVGVSADGRAEQLQVLAAYGNASGGRLPGAAASLTTAMRTAVLRAGLPAGLAAHLAGTAAARVDSHAHARHDRSGLWLLALALVAVLTGILLRSVLAPIAAVLPAVLVVLAAQRLVAEVARHGPGVPADTPLMLTVLVAGVGADHALFLIACVRERLRTGAPAADAVAGGIARAGKYIAVSAVTVIAATLSLLTASVQLYSGLALTLAAGTVLMLAAVLTLVPALLAVLGRAAFWPGKLAGNTSWWGRTAVRIVRRPAVTLGTGLIVLGILAVASAGYAAGPAGAATPPRGSDSAAGDLLLASYFPQTAVSPTVAVFQLPRPAWDDPAALATLGRELAADAPLGHLSGPLHATATTLAPGQYAALHTWLGPAGSLGLAPPVRPVPVTAGLAAQAATRDTPPASPGETAQAYAAYRASALFVSADGRTVEFTGSLPASTAARAIPAVRAGAAHAARAAGATAWGVAGPTATAYDIGSTTATYLRRVIPTALVLMAVLLGIVLRSLVAPVFLTVSLALSYFAALGLAVLLLLGPGHADGLAAALPFMMFVSLLVFGQDHNMRIMTRIRETANHLPLRVAVVRALKASGGTVGSAGAVLAVAAGMLALAGGGVDGGTARQLGVALALGVTMDAFGVRTLLVPSAVLLLGRWNWWPSKRGTGHVVALAGPPAGTPPAGGPPAGHANGSVTQRINGFG